MQSAWQLWRSPYMGVYLLSPEQPFCLPNLQVQMVSLYFLDLIKDFNDYLIKIEIKPAKITHPKPLKPLFKIR
jgi:hypothetical protein